MRPRIVEISQKSVVGSYDQSGRNSLQITPNNHPPDHLSLAMNWINPSKDHLMSLFTNVEKIEKPQQTIIYESFGILMNLIWLLLKSFSFVSLIWNDHKGHPRWISFTLVVNCKSIKSIEGWCHVSGGNWDAPWFHRECVSFSSFRPYRLAWRERPGRSRSTPMQSPCCWRPLHWDYRASRSWWCRLRLRGFRCDQSFRLPWPFHMVYFCNTKIITSPRTRHAVVKHLNR